MQTEGNVSPDLETLFFFFNGKSMTKSSLQAKIFKGSSGFWMVVFLE